MRFEFFFVTRNLHVRLQLNYDIVLICSVNNYTLMCDIRNGHCKYSEWFDIDDFFVGSVNFWTKKKNDSS